MVKYLISVLPLLLFAGCSVNIEPAVSAAGQMKALFAAEQANTLQLVQSANPPAGALQAFQAAQEETRSAFERVCASQVNYLASLGAVKPEEIEAILNKALELKEAMK